MQIVHVGCQRAYGSQDITASMAATMIAFLCFGWLFGLCLSRASFSLRLYSILRRLLRYWLYWLILLGSTGDCRTHGRFVRIQRLLLSLLHLLPFLPLLKLLELLLLLLPCLELFLLLGCHHHGIRSHGGLGRRRHGHRLWTKRLLQRFKLALRQSETKQFGRKKPVGVSVG